MRQSTESRFGFQLFRNRFICDYTFGTFWSVLVWLFRSGSKYAHTLKVITVCVVYGLFTIQLKLNRLF